MVPQGWDTTRLGEVAQVIAGQSPPGETYNDHGEGLPFFQGKAEFGDLFPSPRKWCSQPTKVAEHGDILISIRAPVGPTNLAPSTCCIGRGLAAIRPIAGSDPKYLLYLLRSTAEVLRSKATGSTFEAISAEVLRQHTVQLAPSSEQRRIVEALESYLSRLDNAVASLERVQRNVKRYRASVLRAAVEGRLVPTEAELARAEGRPFEPAAQLLERILGERRRRWEQSELAKLRAKGKDPKNDAWKEKYVEPVPPNGDLPELPAGWWWCSLEQLATLIRNGYSKAPNESSGVPILRINAVRAMHVDLDEIRFLPESGGSYQGFFIEHRDLLFTRYNGSPELVGVCGLVPELRVPTMHPDKLIRVVPIKQLAIPEYLEIATNTGEARRTVEGRIRTTAGQAGISGSDLKQVPIPLPPLSEQSRIATELARCLSIVEASSQAVDVAVKRCHLIRQSILKWAFEGKLVDQDPTDEPASALLDRIRAERAGAPPPKTRGRCHSRPRSAILAPRDELR